MTIAVFAGEPLANYEYDGNNNRTGSIDGRGNRTILSYDRANRLVTANHANIQTETFLYDGVANVLRYNDGFGGDVTSTYDALDHATTRTDGEGNTSRYKFDGEGLLVARVEPKGDAAGSTFNTAYEYNDQRSLTKVTDAAGGAWIYAYNNDQTLAGVTDPLQRATTYEYDALHRVKKVIQPGGVTTSFGYDPNGNRTNVIDPKSQITSVIYDALDRPSEVNYPNAVGVGPRKQLLQYDPESNLTGITETVVNGSSASVDRTYARTYDARSRLQSATDPLGHAVRYLYDAADNLTSLTDSANTLTSYTYDPLNRLQTVAASGRTVNHTWKRDGLLERVDYGNGMSRAYSYDNADRLKTITNTFGSGSNEEFNYSYDANSNRSTETRKLNGQTLRTVGYGYDELDRLTQANYSSNSNGLRGEYFDNKDFTTLKLTRTDPAINFSWQGAATPDPKIGDDTFSIRWSGEIQPEFSENYTFYLQSDEAARLYVNGQLVVNDFTDHTSHEASGTISLEAGKKYDIRLEFAENSGDAEIKMSWSSASQAKQVVPTSKLFTPKAALNYEYDAVGNRKRESGTDLASLPVDRTYAYDDLNRLSGITGDGLGPVAFAYDANGNLKTQTQAGRTTGFDYDVRDQLRRVTDGGSEIASFDYDFERKRISKTSSGIPQNYVYDGDRVVNEYGASNQLVNRYDYGVDLVRGEIGGEGERFYFSDAQGSMTGLAQGSGGLATRYEYDAWGGRMLAQPSLNRIGYTGQYRDEETGLMALGNGERYYSSVLGQFTQQDSYAGALGEPQTLNRHAYVNNNPLRYIDPTGHGAENQYAKEGYIDATFEELKKYISNRENGNGWVNWYLSFSVHNAESVYGIIDAMAGGFIHREDRLFRNYHEGNISGTRLIGGHILNNMVSSPMALANIALLIGTDGMAATALAGGTGTSLAFLGKMGLVGGVIGVANLLADDAFNKTMYDEEFHSGKEYAATAGLTAVYFMFFGALELGGAKVTAGRGARLEEGGGAGRTVTTPLEEGGTANTTPTSSERLVNGSGSGNNVGLGPSGGRTPVATSVLRAADEVASDVTGATKEGLAQLDVATQGGRRASPSSYASGYSELPPRLRAINEVLREPGQFITVPRRTVSLQDLRILSAVNDVEYALLTRGRFRMIVRGETEFVRLPRPAYDLGRSGWRWSGHTHPRGANINTPDTALLSAFRLGQREAGHAVQYRSRVLDPNSAFDLLLFP